MPNKAGQNCEIKINTCFLSDKCSLADTFSVAPAILKNIRQPTNALV